MALFPFFLPQFLTFLIMILLINESLNSTLQLMNEKSLFDVLREEARTILSNVLEELTLSDKCINKLTSGGMEDYSFHPIESLEEQLNFADELMKTAKIKKLIRKYN